MANTNLPENENKETRDYLRAGYDYSFMAVILFLVSFGLVVLYSTSYYSAQLKFGDGMYFFTRQAIFSAVSFLVMLIVAKINYHVYVKLAPLALIVSWVLMAMVRFTPLGFEVNGARRWMHLPMNQSMQPSEVTKIAIILFLPYWISRLGKKFDRKEGIISTIVWAGVTALLTYKLTDHLSAAVIIVGVCYIVMFVANKWSKLIGFIGVAGGAAAYFGARLLAKSLDTGGSSFRLERLLVWINPEAHMEFGGYQILQGLYAIGAGGFFGKGLGNSSQKLGVIPEAQNDMILSIICEELGVFGVILLLLLFGFLLYRLVFIARNAPDLEGSLIVTGIFAHIALQVIFNMCVVLNIFPTTGITLPFISYGGSAIIFLLIEMGIAMSVGDQTRRMIRLEAEEEE